jgi:hypothetical protein
VYELLALKSRRPERQDNPSQTRLSSARNFFSALNDYLADTPDDDDDDDEQDTPSTPVKEQPKKSQPLQVRDDPTSDPGPLIDALFKEYQSILDYLKALWAGVAKGDVCFIMASWLTDAGNHMMQHLIFAAMNTVESETYTKCFYDRYPPQLNHILRIMNDWTAQGVAELKTNPHFERKSLQDYLGILFPNCKSGTESSPIGDDWVQRYNKRSCCHS